MLTDPLIITTLVVAIILVVPLLCKKMHIPAIAGLILTGLLAGPHGLDVLPRDGIIDSLSQIGVLYVMFLSGIEIDINDFKESKGRSLVFGLLTFCIPLVCTFGAALLLGFNLWTSLLMASMMSSHTLMTYPVVSRYGLQRNPAVSIVVGGTIFAVTGTLLILAFVSSRFGATDDPHIWVRMLFGSIVMMLVIFGIMPLLTRWFLRKFTDTIVDWSFIMAMGLLGALMSKAAGIEPILGVFLTALALNKQIPDVSPLMSRINFVGNAIFVPIFLLSVGMLIDLSVFADGWQALLVALMMLATSIPTKWFAAWLTQTIYHFGKYQRQLVFGLTNSHAAGALATVMIGYSILLPDGGRLIPESVLDGTILLILASCTLSSFVTEHAAKHMAQEAAPADSAVDDDLMWLLPAVKTTANRRPKELANILLEAVRQMPEQYRNKLIITDFDSRDNASAMSLLSKSEQSVWMCHFTQPISEFTRVRVMAPESADKETYYAGWQRLLEHMVGALHAEVTQEATADWAVLPRVAQQLAEDELLIVVQSRPLTLSYDDKMTQVPQVLKSHFAEHSFILLYPSQLPAAGEISLLYPTGEQPQSASEQSFIRRLKAKWG